MGIDELAIPDHHYIPNMTPYYCTMTFAYMIRALSIQRILIFTWGYAEEIQLASLLPVVHPS
jgi:hypothetical protein